MPGEQRSFFILDDDTDFCDDLAEALEGEGHRVWTASDAALARDDAITACDVLLLDLAMPTITGVGMLARLRRLAHVPGLILISGSGEELLRTVAVIAQSHGLPVLGTLSKPFDASDVLALVRNPACPEPMHPAHAACAMERLLPALREAVRARTLPVLFQPLVRTDSLVFGGAEALLGNDLPGYGPVAPQDMIQAAMQDDGLLSDLTLLVIEAAVQACTQWQAATDSAPVSVNLPLPVLLREGLVEAIHAILARHHILPSQMVFELTEDAIYHTSPEALATIVQLRLAGFGIALDDVAQRHSGLLQLSHLPVTEIKIDLELLRQARRWDKAKSIFGTITDLGHRLGLTVVAEGVESLDDLVLAQRAGVDYIQGYLVSRKRPLSELLTMQTKIGGLRQPWVQPAQGVA